MFAAGFFAASPDAFANNLKIENVKLIDQNQSVKTINVQFDISWDNSWRDSQNFDASWVFVKYRANTSSGWKHATLKLAGNTPLGCSIGTGTPVEIIVPEDRKGAFIEQTNQAAGTVNTKSVKMVWDYKADGLEDKAVSSADMTVRVFGVEMVYIPKAAFYAGDGRSEASEFRLNISGGQVLPAPVSTENPIAFRTSFSDSGGVWYYASDESGSDDTNGAQFDVTGSFPKGYQAFYLMKYEISQGQYRDFLNTLTRNQQNKRTTAQLASVYAMTNTPQTVFRNGLRVGADGAGELEFTCDVSGDGITNQANDGQWVAANFLSWMDLAAYADWAALRPMTELEFEKACRGSASAVYGQYAWGTASILDANSIINPGQASEAVQESDGFSIQFGDALQGGANFGNDGVQGPMRVGIFATAMSNTRGEASAGYYGNLDLSGNLREMVVTLGNAEGRAFIGTHGDGSLSTLESFEGNANNVDWPGMDGVATRGVTSALGAGEKGGSFADLADKLQVSSRSFAADVPEQRTAYRGGRCARTAPATLTA